MKKPLIITALLLVAIGTGVGVYNATKAPAPEPEQPAYKTRRTAAEMAKALKNITAKRGEHPLTAALKDADPQTRKLLTARQKNQDPALALAAARQQLAQIEQTIKTTPNQETKSHLQHRAAMVKQVINKLQQITQ